MKRNPITNKESCVNCLAKCNICGSFIDHGVRCSGCGKEICMSCSKRFIGRVLCGNCSKKCMTCGKIQAKSEFVKCPNCNPESCNHLEKCMTCRKQICSKLKTKKTKI